MTLDRADARVPVVRWKKLWSDPWILLPRGSCALAGRVREGSGPVVGQAALRTWRVGEINRDQNAPPEPLFPIDAFVQIGAWRRKFGQVPGDPGGGTPPVPPSDTRWLWTGILTRSPFEHQGYQQRRSPDNEVTQSLIVPIVYPIEGLASLFARVTCGTRALVAVNGAAQEVPWCPVFNAHGEGNRWTGGPGNAFDLSRDGTAGRWTARQVIEFLIALHINGSNFPAWPTITWGGQVAALDYDAGEIDVRGRSLLDVITQLAQPARGLTWALESDGTTVELNVRSGLDTDLVVGAITIPASDRQIPLLAADRPHHRFRGDFDLRGRRYRYDGARPLTTCTVEFKPTGGTSAQGLVRGGSWVSADDGQAGSTDETYSDVWRVFALNPLWTGATHGGGQLALALERTSGGGVSRYTGNRLTTGPAFAACMVRLLGELVVPTTATGFAGTYPIAQWPGTPALQLPPRAVRDRVRIFSYDGTTAKELTDQYQVQVSNDPYPVVVVGRTQADAKRLKAAIGSGSLLVTLTVEEPLPVIVSYEPDGATTDLAPAVPSIGLWQVMTGTTLGVIAGALQQAGATRAVRDDRPRLDEALRRSERWLQSPGTATIEDRLDLYARDDAQFRRAGSWIGAIDDGRGASLATQVQGLITSREWGFAPGDYGTFLQVQRIPIDPRSLL